MSQRGLLILIAVMVSVLVLGLILGWIAIPVVSIPADGGSSVAAAIRAFTALPKAI